jgi:hypothetical protein
MKKILWIVLLIMLAGVVRTAPKGRYIARKNSMTMMYHDTLCVRAKPMLLLSDSIVIYFDRPSQADSAGYVADQCVPHRFAPGVK